MSVRAFLTGNDVQAVLKTGSGKNFAKHHGTLRVTTSMLDQVIEKKNLIGMLGMSQAECSYNHLPSYFIYLFFPMGSSPNGQQNLEKIHLVMRGCVSKAVSGWFYMS